MVGTQLVLENLHQLKQQKNVEYIEVQEEGIIDELNDFNCYNK